MTFIMGMTIIIFREIAPLWRLLWLWRLLGSPEYAYLILTTLSQITALFGTTRLFIFDKKSPLHDYLGMHDFDMESKS